MTVDTGEHLNIVSAVNFKGRYAVSGNYSIRQIDRQQAFAERCQSKKIPTKVDRQGNNQRDHRA